MILQAALSCSGTVATYEKLAETDEQRLASSGAGSTIADLKINLAEIHRLSADHGVKIDESMLGTTAVGTIATATMLTDTYAAHAISQSFEVVKCLVDKTRPIAGGGSGGENWATGIKKTHKIAYVTKQAASTLMKHRADDYSKPSEEIKLALKKYKDLCSQYETATDKTIDTAATTMSERLMRTNVEYLIVACHLSKREASEKKSKVHAIEKNLRHIPGAWDNLQPLLKERAHDMMSGV